VAMDLVRHGVTRLDAYGRRELPAHGVRISADGMQDRGSHSMTGRWKTGGWVWGSALALGALLFVACGGGSGHSTSAPAPTATDATSTTGATTPSTTTTTTTTQPNDSHVTTSTAATGDHGSAHRAENHGHGHGDD